jgi:hypothetical protein
MLCSNARPERWPAVRSALPQPRQWHQRFGPDRVPAPADRTWCNDHTESHSVVVGSTGGMSVWYCRTTPSSFTCPPQEHQSGHATSTVRSIRSGTARLETAPYSLPPFLPGFFGFGLGLFREKGPAWRLPARRASSSAWRRAAFSPRSSAFSCLSAPFSRSSASTCAEMRANSRRSSSTAPPIPVTYTIATQIAQNLKPGKQIRAELVIGSTSTTSCSPSICSTRPRLRVRILESLVSLI